MFANSGAPPHARRKKTAAERRAQALRAEGRLIGRILRSCEELQSHRGSQPSKLMLALTRLLKDPESPMKDDFQHPSSFFDWDTLEAEFDEFDNRAASSALCISPTTKLHEVAHEVDSSITFVGRLAEDKSHSHELVNLDHEMDAMLLHLQSQYDMLLDQRTQLEIDAEKWPLDQARIFQRLEELQLRDRQGLVVSSQIQELLSEAQAQGTLKDDMMMRKTTMEAQLRILTEKMSRIRALLESTRNAEPG